MTEPEAVGDFAVLDRLLASRRSARGFRPDPVNRSTIDRLLTSAQRAASWCNTQPWEVVMTSAEETDRLREAFAAASPTGSDIDFPPGYEGVLAERRREVGWQLYEAVGVAKGDREASAREMLRNFVFFDAPHVAILHAPRSLGVYGVLDCGLYIQSFLLAAEALGLGTCAQAAVASHSALLHERYDIGDDRQIVCGIAFGYADPGHASAAFMSRRADLGEVIRFV